MKKINHLEEGEELQLDFQKLKKVAAGDNVIPAIVQDIETKEVLLLGYVNQAALTNTLNEKVATLWSTSRNTLWIKGKTSGDMLDMVEVRVNCEQNSLLYLVKKRTDGACHTKNSEGQARPTCYYRRIDNDKLSFISDEI